MTDGPFPKLDTPFVQPSRSGEPAESGRIIAVPWYRLLITFWNRTGGSLGGVLLAQNNLSDVDSAVTSADNLSPKGVAIASAATTDLASASGTYVQVTGNANISSFGVAAAGVRRIIEFTGTPTLVYDPTKLILQGASNTVVAAGDVGEFISDGGGLWRQTGWLPFAKTGSGAEVYATSPTLNALTLSDLSVNSAVATNGAKKLISVANTGSGSNVLATSPTLVTPILGVASATSINFGGSTLANYDEFTFTITAAFATPGTSTWAYTTQNGRGTRIGRVAQAEYDFAATPTVGTGSGTVTFNGFPYNKAGVSGPILASSMNNQWTWPVSRSQIYGQISVGQAGLVLIGMGSAQATIALAASNMTSGGPHSFRAMGVVEIS